MRSEVLAKVLLLGIVLGSLRGTVAVRAEDAVLAGRLINASGVAGGLIVHVGCEDTAMTVALGKHENFLVHALGTNAAHVAAARKAIHGAGIYGRVSADLWDGNRLPYADGTVNVGVVPRVACRVSEKELMRVLAPRGAVLVKGKVDLSDPSDRTDQTDQSAPNTKSAPGLPGWQLLRKPVPAEIDEWSHYLHGPTGNAVADDKLVGVPKHTQWYATPKWNRSTKTSSMVSSAGRLFAIMDMARFWGRPDWSVIARDAFNGCLLWKRSLPSWGGGGNKKIGPVQIHRTLIARDDRVWVTLGENVPISELDAATGKTLRTFDKTGAAEEMILVGDVLLVLVNRNKQPRPDRRSLKHVLTTLRQKKQIVAVDLKSGKLLWEHAVPFIMPLTLASDAGKVIYHDGKVVVCLDLKTGAEKWRSAPTGQKVKYQEEAGPDKPGSLKKGKDRIIILAPQFGPTLTIYKGVVVFAGGYQINAISLEDGKMLWKGGAPPSGYSVPTDVFGIKGLIWTPDAKSLDFVARDPWTGEQKKHFRLKYGYHFAHHRCYRMKAASDAILASRAGVEFVDLAKAKLQKHHWIRGSCLHGVMPCNGLLYLPPHNCACFIRGKISGFHAFSERSSKTAVVAAGRRLEKGAAFPESDRSDMSDKSDLSDWPAYRHDPARTGCTSTEVPAKLAMKWKRPVGNRLSAPVIAGDRVYIASIDSHTVHALDAATGKPVWRFTAGGRVDSPPTIHRGLAVFGCADGHVYCLRASDGALVWRFMAAPGERRIVSDEQLESTWPVPGSVLVVKGTVYFVAGRSSYIDGGMKFYGLDVATGQQRSCRTIHQKSQEEDKVGLVGWLNDVLSYQGGSIFMRHQPLDLEGKLKPNYVSHLHSPAGFLDDEWHVRTAMTFAPHFMSLSQGAGFDKKMTRGLYPTGRIIVCDDKSVYGWGQNRYPDDPKGQIMEYGGKSCLFSTPKFSNPPKMSPWGYHSKYTSRRLKKKPNVPITFHWWKPIKCRPWGLVLSGDTLFVAGDRWFLPPVAEGEPPRSKAVLFAAKKADGSVLSELSLDDRPVWDGMAAANKQLFISQRNGQAVCLGEKKQD